MIEINLIPDVKEELIKAQQVRNSVVTIAIIAAVVAVAVTALLALYVLGAQTVRGVIADKSIKDENQKLMNVPDLARTLTIQNQLTKLSTMHADKHVTSRVLDVLSKIIPAEPNDVSITNFDLDTDTNQITIEAQASGGYPALEVFKKTINATKFEYSDGDGARQSLPLSSNMVDSDRSYGEDASGKQVLRFTISFVYPDELLSPASTDAVIVAPSRRNATDSYQGVPASLFSNRSQDLEGGQ